MDKRVWGTLMKSIPLLKTRGHKPPQICNKQPPKIDQTALFFGGHHSDNLQTLECSCNICLLKLTAFFSIISNSVFASIFGHKNSQTAIYGCFSSTKEKILGIIGFGQIGCSGPLSLLN